jgi:hypothetical protein
MEVVSMMRRAALVVAVLVACSVGTARSSSLSDPLAAGFSPRVPVSSLARPAAWFDPSRLHMSSTIAVGSGWGGTSSALHSMNFMYQFRAPVTMNVTVGNQLGTGGASGGVASFFLQGLDLSWKPSGNTLVRFQYQDMRSPLQYGGLHGNGYGYGPGNSSLGW